MRIQRNWTLVRSLLTKLSLTIVWLYQLSSEVIVIILDWLQNILQLDDGFGCC